MGKTDYKTVGIVLLCIALAAVYFGKIPIGPTTTAPPVTTIAPVVGIPPGMQPMDWQVKFYNKLYDDNDDNEVAVATDLVVYVFLTDPRAISPRGSVRAMVEVVDDAIDNKLYYCAGQTNSDAYIEILSSGEITDLIQRGVSEVWIVMWDTDWNTTAGYAAVTDWWDVHRIPMSDAVRWQNDQVTIVDYNDPKTAGPLSPEAYKPIGDITGGTTMTITTVAGKSTIEVEFKSCVDATADTNDKGEWIPHYDQPILIKIACTTGFAASTDTIDDVTYNGESIFFDSIAGSGVWYAYLTEAIIGDGSDGSLSTEDLVITYTGFTTGDEEVTVTFYAGSVAGYMFSYPGYNHQWTQPGNPTAATANGIDLAHTAATDMS